MNGKLRYFSKKQASKLVSEHINQHLYLITSEQIPYEPNGFTNGNFLCLDELDHPEDALVQQVGNCGGCRNIRATTNISLGLPNIPDNILRYVALKNGEVKGIEAEIDGTDGVYNLIIEDKVAKILNAM